MSITENTIYNCDCMEVMKEMAREGVIADWCITDVPYGLQIEKMGFTKGARRSGKSKALSRDYSNMGNWDSERINKSYFDEIFKVSKNQIIFGGNYYTDILSATKSWIVWDKRMYDKRDRCDFADGELAWCSKGVARIFNYLYNGMIQGNMKCKDDRFHPTQKPVALWCQLLNYYTKEGDLIFDPFAGSCSLAIACHKLKRRYICCEKDKEYYEKGCAWLEREKSQISMFD